MVLMAQTEVCINVLRLLAISELSDYCFPLFMEALPEKMSSTEQKYFTCHGSH